MDFIGGISAGTLGYIHGNVKGAYAAYRTYRNYSKRRMAPYKRSYNTTTVPSKRFYSQQKKRSFRNGGNKRKSMAYGVKRRGTNIRTVAMSRRGGNKVQKEGFKKQVKVSYQLRQKITKVIKGHIPHGYAQESYYENLNVPRDSQLVHDMGARLVDGGHGYFSPTEILDTSSILWNIKVPAANKGFADTGNFNIKNLEVMVTKQWIVYRLKNNSQITMTVKLIDWSPKQTKGDGEDPSDAWSNELALQAPIAPGEGYNLNSIGVTELHTTPQMFPGFRSQFSTQQKTITIEPGKTYVHTLSGPNQKTYKFDSFNQGGDYTNGQTFTKGTLLVAHADLLGTATEGVTRVGNSGLTSGNQYGLLIETTHYKSLNMPEFAGFTAASPASPGVPLDLRKDAMYIEHFNITSGDDAAAEISDEQPADPIVIPL